jgi:uncharacterized damage-inducible protein DinB
VRSWADELTRIHAGDADGEAVHGPSLRRLLADVDSDRAAARPLPAGHSIWEVVLHLAAWRERVLARLRGEVAPPMAPADDWPPVPASLAPSAWRDALRRLEATHDALVESLRALAPEREAELEDVLTFLLHHDLYHAGQIGLLRRG